MSDQEEREIIDPEQHFLHTLIRRWDEIGSYLYRLGIWQSITTRKAMMALISRLPNNEKETVFKDLYYALENSLIGDSKTYRNNFSRTIVNGRVFYMLEQSGNSKRKYYSSYIEAYREISAYLGETYFRNFRVARPKRSEGGVLEV